MAMSVRAPGHSELIDRKSRFIGDVNSVLSRAEVDDRIAEMRSSYPDSSHVVHAFALGPPESQIRGLSDDHEPHGTAGRPILDVLIGRDITNAVVTVVRYFGGTKLGTGGLVRAYSEAAKLALDDAEIEELRDFVRFHIIADYQHFDQIRRVLSERDTRDIEEDFGTRVSITGLIERSQAIELPQEVADSSRGDATVGILEESDG